MAEEIRYDAFISYRHCSPDKEIAEKIHKKLENYKLPRALAKKIKRRRLERVFRDEAELAVSAELSAEIEKALLHSEYLIVICTPRLQESEWCMKEIDTFLKISDRNHILLVLAEGEPDESFPEILRYEEVEKQSEDGQTFRIREKREPLAGDCRGNTGKKRKEAMQNTVLRLCATMFGVHFDDLKQRQKESQMRTNAFFAGLIFLVVFCIGAQNTYFLTNEKKQKAIIEDKLATITANSSRELLAEGRKMDAIYTARSVLPDTDHKGYNENAYRALQNAMFLYASPNLYMPQQTFSVYPYSIKMNYDGKLLFSESTDGFCRVLNTVTGEEVSNFDVVEDEYVVFEGDQWLVRYNKKTLIYQDVFNGETREVEVPAINEDGAYYDLYPSPTGEMVILSIKDAAYATSEGKILYRINNEALGLKHPGGYIGNISFTDDGEYALIMGFSENSKYASIVKIDAKSGTIIATYQTNSGIFDAIPLQDGFLVVQTTLKDEKIVTELLHYDTRLGDFDKKFEYEGDDFFNLYQSGDLIAMYNYNQFILLDMDLNKLYAKGVPSVPLLVFTYDGAISYFLQDGYLYRWNEEYKTIQQIPVFPQDTVLSSGDRIHYLDDRLFLARFGTDYITEYGVGKSDCLIKQDDYDFFEYDYAMYQEPEEFVSQIAGRDSLEVNIYKISSDKKYIALQTKDNMLYIYDYATLEKVKEMFVLEGSLSNFVYSVENKSYFVDFLGWDVTCVAILDEDFRYNTEIQGATLNGVQPGTGEPVIGLSDYYSYTLNMPDYEEVIKRADEKLAGYQPEEKVLEKYGLK